jgi:hypothetical protein
VVGHDKLKIIEGLDNRYKLIDVRNLKSLNELELSSNEYWDVEGRINKVEKLSYMKLSYLNFTGQNDLDIDEYEDLDEL